MLDYKAIEALHAVLEWQSFEVAAKKNHITQSAISQRIKGLESFYGEPLLIRTLPYKPTKLGQQLIAHFKQVALLENDFKNQLGEKELFHIAIAINRDSLETWFLKLIEKETLFNNVILQIVADDQELTLEYLKAGKVSACLSTSEKEVLGGKVEFLGYMEYLLVASPAFVNQYFAKGVTLKTLKEAPAIKFDQNDYLHERYLEKYFHFSGEGMNYHFIPSVRGFKLFALMGYGYGLIPKIDSEKELKEKKLINLLPQKTWKIPFYWHSWAIQSNTYQKFNKQLIQLIKNNLR